eukprot:30802-Pelagococcus_subviridis.AAC.32
MLRVAQPVRFEVVHHPARLASALVLAPRRAELDERALGLALARADAVLAVVIVRVHAATVQHVANRRAARRFLSRVRFVKQPHFALVHGEVRVPAARRRALVELVREHRPWRARGIAHVAVRLNRVERADEAETAGGVLTRALGRRVVVVVVVAVAQAGARDERLGTLRIAPGRVRVELPRRDELRLRAAEPSVRVRLAAQFRVAENVETTSFHHMRRRSRPRRRARVVALRAHPPDRARASGLHLRGL